MKVYFGNKQSVWEMGSRPDFPQSPEVTKIAFEEDEEDKTEESGENLIEMARDILSGKEHAKTNDISSSLYFENEFDGIDFNEEKFTVYGKPHKRSGPSGNGKSPRIIIEEVTKKLKK